MERKVNEFKAFSDAGEAFTLQVWQRLIVSRSLSGTETIPAMRTIRTSDGLLVHRIDKDTFQIDQTETILRRR